MALCVVGVLALAACGGGGNANIQGTVSGLGTGLTVTLQNNGTDTLTVSANGQFTFPSSLSAGAAYNVTVYTNPVGQVCQVSSGSGNVDSNGDNVNTVAVACISTSTLSGTLSGLNSGLGVTLTNGTVLLPLAANGSFSFPGNLLAGATYQVSVAVQPIGQTCTVTNGIGTVPSSGTTIAITVTCA